MKSYSNATDQIDRRFMLINIGPLVEPSFEGGGGGDKSLDKWSRLHDQDGRHAQNLEKYSFPEPKVLNAMILKLDTHRCTTFVVMMSVVRTGPIYRICYIWSNLLFVLTLGPNIR